MFTMHRMNSGVRFIDETRNQSVGSNAETFARLRNEEALPDSGVPVQIRNHRFLRHNPALDYKWYELPTLNSRIVVLVVPGCTVWAIAPFLSRHAVCPFGNAGQKGFVIRRYSRSREKRVHPGFL